MHHTPTRGYAAGNILNMLIHLEADLTGYDFSGLSVWQAYLQGTKAQNIHFVRSQFFYLSFNDTFGQVYRVRYSSAGTWLAVTASNLGVRVWQGHNLVQILHLPLHAHTVTFSPDEQYLVTAGSDRTIYFWDIQTGQCVRHFSGHRGQVYALSFADAGRILISGGDSTVRLWNVDTGECSTLDLDSFVSAVAVHPDGHTFAVATGENVIQIRDIQSLDLSATCQGHSHEIRTLAFSPDGNTLASGSYDETIRLWSTHTGHCTLILQKQGESYLREVAFSPCGTFLASASDRGNIHMCNVKQGEHEITLQPGEAFAEQQ
ncbi:MAG: WD40 repeat domain-containing protein [Chloroflexaceae bacterium]|nr:WD40 repeat domain-containing protein [Chloroflexaceae bacterium]